VTPDVRSFVQFVLLPGTQLWNLTTPTAVAGGVVAAVSSSATREVTATGRTLPVEDILFVGSSANLDVTDDPTLGLEVLESESSGMYGGRDLAPGEIHGLRAATAGLGFTSRSGSSSIGAIQSARRNGGFASFAIAQGEGTTPSLSNNL
jgi:hypothetical protein